MEQLTLDGLLGAPTSAHVVRGNGPMHEWTCPACVAAHTERRERDNAQNPHRIGTKARDKRAREDAMVRLALDPRCETYWSL